MKNEICDSRILVITEDALENYLYMKYEDVNYMNIYNHHLVETAYQ